MHESEKWKWSHSVVFDSSWPYGLQPTRLLRPWGFPGKNAGWAAIAFSTYRASTLEVKEMKQSLLNVNSGCHLYSNLGYYFMFIYVLLLYICILWIAWIIVNVLVPYLQKKQKLEWHFFLKCLEENNKVAIQVNSGWWRFRRLNCLYC